jgi:hypothetical protein
MNDRTITALYEAQADAHHAADALRAAGFDKVEIHDQEDHGQGEGFMAKLKAMFRGHKDAHAYAEGVRRGHYLLTLKVSEQQEIRAAEVLEASNIVDIEDAQETWRGEGWAAPEWDMVGTGVTTAGGGPAQAVTGPTGEEDRQLSHDAYDRLRSESSNPTTAGRAVAGGSAVDLSRIRSY